MNLLLFNLKTDADDTVLGFTTEWINELAKHCEHITVITMTAGRIAVAPNVEVFSVGKEKGWSELRRAGEFYRLLWRTLRHRRFDACFAHMMPLFALMGWPLLNIDNIPVTLWYAHGYVSWLLRVTTRLVDNVVTSSKSGFQIETPKLRIIGQGIDTTRFSPRTRQVPGDRLVVLTVGRVSAVKRLELLIEALALLGAENRNRILVRFVGDPITGNDKLYLKELQDKAAAMGVADIIEFVPGVAFHRIHDIYAEADIFVNSSNTDSIDKTVLEAMSSGLPVVTSNVAFMDVLDPDLSDDWVIEKGKAQPLAERLSALIEMSPETRSNLGIRLRDAVQRYHTLPALIERLMSIMKR